MAEGQGRSSRQELKLLYLRDYFYKYTNKDNPKRMKAILDYLEANGIPASRVTVYNDIEILRNALHIPIKYSAKHYGYYVEKPQFESHEMLMLLDCIRFSTFITEDETERLRQKVMALASVYDAELVNNVAPEETHVLKASVSIYDNLRILLDPIRYGKKISFVMLQYVADRSYAPKTVCSPLVIHPHRLELQNGKYILFFAPERSETDLQTLVSTNPQVAAILKKSPQETWSVLHDRVRKLKASGALDKLLQDMKREQFLQEWKDMYQEIEVSKMDSIQILDEPSIYAEQKHRNAKQESEKALDKRSGTKRAITIWFSNSVLERVALELGKDAILLPADRDGFITTITKRPDKHFYNWLETFGENAELRAPDDLVEKYASRKKAMLSEKLLRSFYGSKLKDT